LAQAAQWFDLMTKSLPRGALGVPPTVLPTEWFVFQVLRREALLAIDGKVGELPPLWAGRGNAWAALGEWDRAAEHWSRAVDLKPADADYRFERGRAWAELKQWDKADEDFSAAVAAAKADPKLVMECARVYADKQRW